jgi:hypothetical protein
MAIKKDFNRDIQKDFPLALFFFMYHAFCINSYVSVKLYLVDGKLPFIYFTDINLY